MNLDIRSHIINNFKGDDINVLRDAIEESIKNNDEITLPGMGVFFELVWQKADDDTRNKILTILESCVKGNE
ncbi:MAG: small acid-soluble spore protein SspI [Tenericutes bacterium]|nr:small acid-soluble spore protein SspI [Mycoplasmatota bacterium]